MHISKLNVVNYRNFKNTTLHFNEGVNTIIGENGSGKTNLFRAIRLLIEDKMLGMAYRLSETDFHRGLDNWRCHWIIISIEFDKIGPDESIQALFLHGTGVIEDDTISTASYNLIFRPRKEFRQRLANLENGDFDGLAEIRNEIQVSDYETVFTGRSNTKFENEETLKEIVGDFENCIFPEELDDERIGIRLPQYLSVSKELSVTYIQALRDVVSEFHNNRTNPLLKLLKYKSGDIPEENKLPIVGLVRDLNNSIESLEDIKTVRSNIRETITDAVGETYSPHSLTIKSNLSEDTDQLLQSLKLFVGESEVNHEGEIHELSLGGANLIFLTLKILEFSYQSSAHAIANFLLIEEPEAHIHTHIQKTLFENLNYPNTQIIYSTHSPQISEVCNVESVNILGRLDATCEAFQPTTGLNPTEIQGIQRYLDAIRSNLLFAKSVLLVEGDSEEILVPFMVKKALGISLDELGISLINIRSTGFKNVADLFHQDRIRKRCCIITDLDASIIETNSKKSDSVEIAKYKVKCANSATAGERRKAILDEYVANNDWLSVKYASHTFEVDYILSGNVQDALKTVEMVYSDATTIETSKNELSSEDVSIFGKRILTMAKHNGKGWYAILLAGHVNDQTILPEYIWDAIRFVKPDFSKKLISGIVKYRILAAIRNETINAETATDLKHELQIFLGNKQDFNSLKIALAEKFPGDNINTLLANMR